MTEGVSSSSDAAAARAAEQARLRKERREAKIKAGGSARLDKITGGSKRPAVDTKDEVPAPNEAVPAASATAAPASTTAADPDEVDISQHYYERPKTRRTPQEHGVPQANLNEDQLRQMMLGFDPANAPAAPSATSSSGAEDPMMKMLQQMMGGAGAGDAAGAGTGAPGAPGAGEDPMMKMMEQMLGAGAKGPGASGMPSFPGMPGAQQQAYTVPDTYTSLWRLLHALVALGLGLYIALLTPFDGTRHAREQGHIAYDAGEDDEDMHRKSMFFWVFATAEAVLLTTRFFLDKSRPPPQGIVYMVIGFLPEPFKGIAETVMKYGQIVSTVRGDILACMFVLGVCHWWRA